MQGLMQAKNLHLIMDESKPIKPKKSKSLLVIGIVVLLLIALGLAGWDISKLTKDVGQSRQTGYNQGAIDIITYIATQASQCKQVPLNVSGQITILVSVNCLGK